MRGDVNLCSMGRGARLRMATIGLGIAIAQVILLAEVGASPIWWVTVAGPLSLVSLHLVQAYTGVCVFHAREGTRVMGNLVEPILDPRKRIEVQRRGRAVTAMAVTLTAVATSLVVVLAAFR